MTHSIWLHLISKGNSIESGWSAHGQWIILMDLRLLSQVVQTSPLLVHHPGAVVFQAGLVGEQIGEKATGASWCWTRTLNRCSHSHAAQKEKRCWVDRWCRCHLDNLLNRDFGRARQESGWRREGKLIRICKSIPQGCSIIPASSLLPHVCCRPLLLLKTRNKINLFMWAGLVLEKKRNFQKVWWTMNYEIILARPHSVLWRGLFL